MNSRNFRNNRRNRNRNPNNTNINQIPRNSRIRRKPVMSNRNLSINYNISNNRRRTNFKKRLRNKFNRVRRAQNRKLQREVNKITDKLDNMSIKTTNLIVPKKEVRYDKLMSPYNMARRGQYIPIYEIKEKVLNMSVYTKLIISLEGNAQDIDYYLMFFPYSINFKPSLMDEYPYRIGVSGGFANTYKNIFFLAHNNTLDTFTMSYKETAPSGVIGNWKLIGSTMKIYNVANMLNKGGDYTIVKIQNNSYAPCFVRNDGIPTMSSEIGTWMTKDYSQAPRNNFSANDTAFIDEYNVSEGTNIFNSPIEYMGCKYVSANLPHATYPYDMVGNNVVYMFQTKGMGTPQTYVFEIWNVFSVIPSPDTGLGNLGVISKKCFTKEVVDSIKLRPSMYKANK